MKKKTKKESKKKKEKRNSKRKLEVTKDSGKKKERKKVKGVKRKLGRKPPEKKDKRTTQKIAKPAVKKKQKKEESRTDRKREQEKTAPLFQEKAIKEEAKTLFPVKEEAKEKVEPAVENMQAPLVDKEKDIIIDEKEKKRLLEKYKPAEKRKNEFVLEVKDIDSLLEQIKDGPAVYILKSLRKKDPSLLDKLFLGKTFDSERELVKYLKEETVKLLVSEVDSLKARVSELRKKGGDVNYSDFYIMQIPLKIKLFSASFDKKDFDAVKHLLHKASIEVKEAERAFSENNPIED